MYAGVLPQVNGVGSSCGGFPEPRHWLWTGPHDLISPDIIVVEKSRKHTLQIPDIEAITKKKKLCGCKLRFQILSNNVYQALQSAKLYISVYVDI